MKLGVLTAIWKRPRLTELFLRYTELLPFEVLVAVVSPEDPTLPDIRAGQWQFVEHKNEPLADKFLAGAAALRGQCDAVMILGSDDFVTLDYIEHCCSLLTGGPQMIVPRHIHYFDAIKCRLMRIRHRHPGAGRVLSAELCERLKWELWKREDGNVDGSMDARMKEVIGDRWKEHYTYIEDPVGVILDVKTKLTQWSYQYLRDGAHVDATKQYLSIEPAPFLEATFPQIAHTLLNWNAVRSNADGRKAA